MTVMNPKIGLLVNPADNVATIFVNDILAGDAIRIMDHSGKSDTVIANDSIPYGHKIAIQDMATDTQIIKYGEKIGLASMPIKRGDHVHIHNLESDRGRGDR